VVAAASASINGSGASAKSVAAGASKFDYNVKEDSDWKTHVSFAVTMPEDFGSIP